jgi:hypothetical protein
MLVMGELARQPLEPDADADESWAAEIERRRQRALAGTAETIAWDIARAKIEADLRRP